MKSSWIDSIRYKKLPDGSSYVAIFLKRDEALLYGGPESPIPSWLPGLVQAGTGGKSVGHAYHKLVKGKYTSQRVEGKEAVQELRRMLS